MPTEKECSGCGRVAAVGPDVAFCFKCGSALVDAQPPPPDPEPKKDDFGLRLRKGGFIGNDRVRQRHVESHAIPLKVSETEHLTPCNNAPTLELSKVGNTLYQPPLLSNARSIIAGWRRRLLAVAGTLFGTSVVALETISKWQVANGDGTTGVRTQAVAIRCSSTPFCRSVPEQHGTWRAMLESVPQPTGAQDTACAQNRPTSPRRCVGCVADSRVWRRLDDPKDCHTPCPSTGAVGHPR